VTPINSLLSVLADPEGMPSAKVFAAKHDLSCYQIDQFSERDHTPYILQYANSAISLIQTGKGAPGPISASFLAGKNAHRRQFGGGTGQLIAKAVGIASGIRPAVVDATAGLGRDAFVLASLGCPVTMLERSPIAAELLRDALAEARGSEIEDIVSRMSLVECDGASWLASKEGYAADVIYLDPMYPTSDKSAKVKKEMKAFHDLVGESSGDAQLLEAALAKARCRVVVKRPRKGQVIEGIKPSYELTGKSCRYDIYALSSLSVLKQK
jgi:16S rRNA (guanine1516-N2)-methyltransferase